jgi:hypothetical protein
MEETMRPQVLRGRRWARLSRSRLMVYGATVLLGAGVVGYAMSGATAGTGPPGSAGRTGSPAAAGLSTVAGGASAFNAATGTTVQPPQQPPQTDVTLITGDRAELATAPDGQQVVNPVPAAGEHAARGSSGFAEFSWGGDEYLVPDEAAAYLASGVLDPRLFDVSYLAQAKFGSALPVQITYQGTTVPACPACTSPMPPTAWRPARWPARRRCGSAGCWPARRPRPAPGIPSRG